MIIVKIDAGLGNQMLEHCFYKKLKHDYPDIEIKVDLDRFIFKKFIPHNGYELKKVFAIDYTDIATTEEIVSCRGEYQRHANGIIDILKKKYYTLKGKIKIDPNAYSINQCKWDDFALVHRDHMKDLNCWVDNCWYTLYEPAIKDFEYTLPLTGKNKEAAERMKLHDSVSVHIRRGDYVGTSYDVLKKDYYLNAMQFMKSKLDDPFFFFFSDDPEYVEREYAGLDLAYEVIANNRGSDSHYDMQLMSNCRNHIICNSTFSMWGAVLGKNPGKYIFKPDILADHYMAGGGIWISSDNNGRNIRVLS